MEYTFFVDAGCRMPVPVAGYRLPVAWAGSRCWLPLPVSVCKNLSAPTRLAVLARNLLSTLWLRNFSHESYTQTCNTNILVSEPAPTHGSVSSKHFYNKHQFKHTSFRKDNLTMLQEKYLIIGFKPADPAATAPINDQRHLPLHRSSTCLRCT